MQPAIRIEDLGKRYRVNHAVQHAPYRTLRDALVSAAAAPLRRLRAGGHDGSVEDFWALREISFDVQPGEVVGIIGRNGAGKSTLLKILSRITKPTTGRVTLRGRVGSLLEVGTGFHPELTGRENIYLNGGILGMSRKEIDRNFDAIVEFSGVEKFLDTPVKRYSSGMYVRLAFAVAAHLSCDILLVDEVLAVGDASFRKKCLGKMENVASSGSTVLFVSHDLGAISQICQRSLLVRAGMLADDGPTDRILRCYLEDAALQGEVDLRDRKTRTRTVSPLSLAGVALRSADGRTCSQLSFGDSCEFEITVTSSASLPFVMGLRIHDATGVLVLHLVNLDDAAPLQATGSETHVFVRVPRIVLNDGTYFVSIALGDSLASTVDLAEHCLQFEVASPNSGRINSRGKVRISAEWSIR